jgi:hypothetical protein
MWNMLVTAGGWLLAGVVIVFWVHWIDLESKQFSNGDWPHLE